MPKSLIVGALGRPNALDWDYSFNHSFTLVHSFATFVLVACLRQLAGGGSAGGPHAGHPAAGGADRARFRASLRSVTNLGISVGALAADGAPQFGTARPT